MADLYPFTLQRNGNAWHANLTANRAAYWQERGYTVTPDDDSIEQGAITVGNLLARLSDGIERPYSLADERPRGRG